VVVSLRRSAKALLAIGAPRRFNGPPQHDTSLTIGVMGSLIVQALLRFESRYVTDLVNSLVGGENSMVVDMCLNPAGSRVLEAFLQSLVVVTKHKHKVVGKLKGSLLRLAKHKTGSRCVEACYRAGDLGTKDMLASELCTHLDQLNSDSFGMFVVRSCRLETYLHKQQQWRAAHAKSDKTKKLFADITGENQDDSDTEAKAAEVNTPDPDGGSMPHLATYLKDLGFARAAVSSEGKASKKEKTPQPVLADDDIKSVGSVESDSDDANDIDAIFTSSKLKEAKNKKHKRKSKGAEGKEKHPLPETPIDSTDTKPQKHKRTEPTEKQVQVPETKTAKEKTKKNKSKGAIAEATTTQKVTEETVAADEQADDSMRFVLDAIQGTRSKGKNKRKKQAAEAGSDSDTNAKRKRKFVMG